MSSYWALQSVVFMIAFVFVFDGIHQRIRNYRRLWEMYRELQAGTAFGDVPPPVACEKASSASAGNTRGS